MKKLFGAVLIFLTACSVFNGMESVRIPTAIPGTINILIAQTAAAASTQTAMNIPPTLTPSYTPFPSQSPSLTPADTPTFLFLLPTPTATPSRRFLPIQCAVLCTGQAICSWIKKLEPLYSGFSGECSLWVSGNFVSAICY